MASDSDVRLNTSGRFVQYDTLGSDPKYMNLDETASDDNKPVCSLQSPEEIKDISPVSVDSTYIGKCTPQTVHGNEIIMSSGRSVSVDLYRTAFVQDL